MSESTESPEIRLAKIEAQINSIIERNNKVELEKAWETSSFRKASVLALTYCLMSLTFYAIGVANYLISSIIPTLGYLLSTQSLPILKKYWLKCRACK